jgi:hypothetical protein
MPGYQPGQVAVRRRFNEFLWLQHRLQQRHPGQLVPPLPEKKFVFGAHAGAARGPSRAS